MSLELWTKVSLIVLPTSNYTDIKIWHKNMDKKKKAEDLKHRFNDFNVLRLFILLLSYHTIWWNPQSRPASSCWYNDSCRSHHPADFLWSASCTPCNCSPWCWWYTSRWTVSSRRQGTSSSSPVDKLPCGSRSLRSSQLVHRPADSARRSSARL